MNRYEIKMVLIGDEDTGKSKFCEKLLPNKNNINFDEYLPTIGGSFLRSTINFQHRTFNINIWDTAGQERFQPLIIMYLPETNIVLIFYNPLKKKSFERVKVLLNTAKDYLKNDNNIIYALIGSKYDLKLESNDEENVEEEEALEFADKNNLIFFHLSNKEKYNNYTNEIMGKVLNEYIKKKNI